MGLRSVFNFFVPVIQIPSKSEQDEAKWNNERMERQKRQQREWERQSGTTKKHM